MAKNYKKDFSYSYAIGVFPVIELLRNKPDKATRVYIHPKGERNVGIKEILDICGKENIPVEENGRFIEKVSSSENVYAAAVFNKYESRLNLEANHVVLVNPSDPGNLGTICRTMLGFGFSDLGIIKPGADIFNPKTIRASMGAIFQLNFQYFSSFEDYRKNFSQNVYVFMTDGKETLGKFSFKKPYVFVFGNEGEGLDQKFKKIGDSIKIPQSGKVDSLNLSAAVAVSLYEAMKTNK